MTRSFVVVKMSALNICEQVDRGEKQSYIHGVEWVHVRVGFAEPLLSSFLVGTLNRCGRRYFLCVLGAWVVKVRVYLCDSSAFSAVLIGRTLNCTAETQRTQR